MALGAVRTFFMIRCMRMRIRKHPRTAIMLQPRNLALPSARTTRQAQCRRSPNFRTCPAARRRLLWKPHAPPKDPLARNRMSLSMAQHPPAFLRLRTPTASRCPSPRVPVNSRSGAPLHLRRVRMAVVGTAGPRHRTAERSAEIAPRRGPPRSIRTREPLVVLAVAILILIGACSLRACPNARRRKRRSVARCSPRPRPCPAPRARGQM